MEWPRDAGKLLGHRLMIAWRAKSPSFRSSLVRPFMSLEAAQSSRTMNVLGLSKLMHATFNPRSTLCRSQMMRHSRGSLSAKRCYEQTLDRWALRNQTFHKKCRRADSQENLFFLSWLATRWVHGTEYCRGPFYSKLKFLKLHRFQLSAHDVKLRVKDHKPVAVNLWSSSRFAAGRHWWRSPTAYRCCVSFGQPWSAGWTEPKLIAIVELL